VAEPGIDITRVFQAPRERVWREWTEPERFADWFGGEAEIPPATVRMDVRRGGRWRLTMFAGPDRREIRWKGEYLEVLEPERLVFTVSDRPDEVYELVTVVLTDLGDGRTEMRFSQTGHLSPAQYRRAGSGWASFFDGSRPGWRPPTDPCATGRHAVPAPVPWPARTSALSSLSP
jgi:uncharacterized protein YndB with AHSA1/START domain